MDIYAETGAEGHAEEAPGPLHPFGSKDKSHADLEYIFQQRALFTSNIHLADQKSGYIAILHGVLLSGISSVMQNDQILDKLARPLDRWLFSITMITLFLSFGANMLAFVPRSRPVSNDNSWTDIAEADPVELVHAITSETPIGRMHRTAKQVKTLARICNYKFEYIRYAIIFVSVATVVSVIQYLRLILT